MTELYEETQRAAQLLRDLDAQRVAETDAYWRGWRDCAAAERAKNEDAWSDGWIAAEADMEEEWAIVARKVRALGSPDAHTHDERRAAELAACKPRPGDFPGLESDPTCLDRYRADHLLPVRTKPFQEEAA